jgi:hypothetical protein
VTTDWVRIGNRIYWTLVYTGSGYILQISVTWRLVFSDTFFTALIGINLQQKTLLFFRAPVLAGWWPSQDFIYIYIYIYWHGPHRKHRLQPLIYCCLRVSRGHHVTDVKPFPSSGRVCRPVPQQGLFLWATVLALSKYATVLITIDCIVFSSTTIGLLPLSVKINLSVKKRMIHFMDAVSFCKYLQLI